MKDWFQEDWAERFQDWAEKFDEDLPENSRQKIDEVIENMSDSKEDYYSTIMENCNEVFEDVEFVDFQEAGQFPHIVFFELENGSKWDVDLHPMKYILHEVNDQNYEEKLKGQFQARVD